MSTTIDVTEFQAISPSHGALGGVAEGLRLLQQHAKATGWIVSELRVEANVISTFGNVAAFAIDATWRVELQRGNDRVSCSGVSWSNLARQVEATVSA